ncbi:ribosomal protein S18-alanine N-acetyltransferase [Chloroflexota bacterium]
MHCSIRRMLREDISQVTEIDREAFPTQWPPANYKHELGNQLARYIVACDETVESTEPHKEPTKEPNGFISRLVQQLKRGNSPRAYLPGPDEQNIAGFAGIWVLADEAHITNIAVRTKYRRQGIGELLLIQAIELAKELKAEIMTLEVRVSNIAAQNLYYKYGFTQVGLRRAYYTDNREDGMLMSTENVNLDSYQALFRQLKQAYEQKWHIQPPAC